MWSVFVDRYKPLLYDGSCRCILVFCLFFRAVVASYPWQAGAEGRKLPISDSSRKVCSFSWWKYIVMSEEDYRQDGSLVLIHEKNAFILLSHIGFGMDALSAYFSLV